MKPLLAVVVAFAAPLALAQSPAPAAKHWPWDMRPNKCLARAGHALPGTACAEAPPWPAYSVAADHVGMLFASPDFDLIERAENDLAYSNAQFESASYLFEDLDGRDGEGTGGSARASHVDRPAMEGSEGGRRLRHGGRSDAVAEPRLERAWRRLRDDGDTGSLGSLPQGPGQGRRSARRGVAEGPQDGRVVLPQGESRI